MRFKIIGQLVSMIRQESQHEAELDLESRKGLLSSIKNLYRIEAMITASKRTS
jgi:hypothetical protein